MKTCLTVSLLFALACTHFKHPERNSANASVEMDGNFDITVDTHEDTPQRFLDDNYDVGSTNPLDTDFISLDKARAGHLDAVFFSIWVDPEKYQGRFAKRTLDLIDSVYVQAARHPDRMTMCFSVEDIRRAHDESRLAALLGIEGGHSIENDLSSLRDFYRRGARYMTLTWNNTNDWADASGDIERSDVVHHNGLTDFGRQVVLEMNRLGMMVDVSHVSDKTFWDVLAVSKAPIIASHSSARALVDIPRNLSDDMLRAIGRNGGVVNVAFGSSFVDNDFNREAYPQHLRMLAAAEKHNAKRRAASLPVSPEETQGFEAEWLGKNKISRPPLKSLIDHIDHVARVAGIDHVGLGSDSDGIDFLPADLDSSANLPEIRQALLDRNYSREDVNKIMGGNMLQVFIAVERASRELRTPVNSR
ncbi:MAG TPA: dipeptidase [Candidatus Acidoferrales bacterium]|jgi:membrane dipeptidase|nr:dipeptidase [Candidatus Acidoferrales bacterium]